MSDAGRVRPTIEDRPKLLSYAKDPNAPDARRNRRRMVVWTGVFCLFYGMMFAFFAPYLIMMFVIPPAILALLTIWALPDMNVPPVKSLTFLLSAYIVAVIAWPNYLALALPGLPWITVSRLTGFPLAFFLLVCVSVSQDFRSTMAAVLKPSSLMWKFLVGFVVIEVLTIGVSAHKAESVNQIIVQLIAGPVVFFASCYAFLKPGRVVRTAGLFWVLAVFVCLIGLPEYQHSHVPWAGHVPGFLKIENPDVIRILAGQRRSADGIYRVQSTFSTALGLGEYLALVMPFVLQFAVGEYRPRTQIAAALSIPLMMFIVLVTGSRLGFIGCLISFVLYLLAWSVLRLRRHKNSLVASTVLFGYPIFFTLAVASTFLSHRLAAKVWGNGPQQASDDGRKMQWAMGIPKILSHPQGHGAGSSGDVLGYITATGVTTVDSYYLTLLLDFGILGLIFYVGFIATGLYQSVGKILSMRMLDGDYAFLAPIAISLVNFLVIKSVFSQPDNHPVVFAMVGMAVALIYRLSSAETVHAPARLAAVAKSRSLVRGTA